MSRRRTAWWVYLVAVLFALTFFFNARQEVWGPANAGWTPAWPTVKVAAVTPGGPMDKAGLRVGDVFEAADERPLTAMPDWFVARAHFERERPICLKIRRNEQPLNLHLVLIDPAFHAWNRAQFDGVLALLLVRLILLSSAVFLAFSRSGRQPSARIAALMLAVGAVAEGYPSAGWAAALGHLPALLAIPVCLASRPPVS
jgi:membrane-associated protease RseP (regulator of RpoE activity)